MHNTIKQYRAKRDKFQSNNKILFRLLSFNFTCDISLTY